MWRKGVEIRKTSVFIKPENRARTSAFGVRAITLANQELSLNCQELTGAGARRPPSTKALGFGAKAKPMGTRALAPSFRNPNFSI